MDVVIILLYVFLIIVGIISIIASLVDLNSAIKTESDSSLETKWFKWKAPVRLVFGLLCILTVIILNKIEISQVDKKRLENLEKEYEEISHENFYLKDKICSYDSLNNFYFLNIEDGTGKSILQGRVLFSIRGRTLKIKGALPQKENYENVNDEKVDIETGDRFYIKVDEELWGINVLEANINSNFIKLEIYKKI